MKTKVILTAMILFVLLFVPIRAEQMAFLFSGGVWTDDGFESAGGGFLTGVEKNLDAGRGLYARLLYHQFYVGSSEPVQSIAPSLLLKYSLGKQYSIYFGAGGEEYAGDGESGAIFGSFGFAKTIWTGPVEGNLNPWIFKIFLQNDFINHDPEKEGQSFRLYFGFAFYPVEKP